MNGPEARHKLETMREHILDKARHDGQYALEEARKSAAAWRLEEENRLEKETELLLRNARTRAEEMRLRQTGAAQRERNKETLRTRNHLIRDATRMLAEGLEGLRQRETYPAILRGLLVESMEGMSGVEEVRILLSGKDRHLARDLAEFARHAYPGVRFSAGEEPAPISGGLWLLSQDGKRQVNADWDARVREMLPLLADRLGTLL